ncbi:MAG TPA: transcription antitermination factor NusB [Candidatus Merdicola faecigallinarum]|uniref:Transcription antitermination protein NusB n=1 Tax=Candidatus Merdicola faecigallinarum TaxID=2840862 RepID=A0A9D1LZJ2_9FIRM|nr:transcription antitermination factor NusB [Candidatus Merdicola faecigallinarum]
MDRSARREMVFKLLYSLEIQKTSNEEEIKLFIENNGIIENEDQEYIANFVNGVIENNARIREEISQNLKKEWSIERISKIDLALLELAIYEILYKKVPFKVVINEVVELAKKYGEEQSPNFINGILANIVKKIGVEE